MKADLELPYDSIHVTAQSICDRDRSRADCDDLVAELPQETGHALGCAKEGRKVPEQPQPACNVRQHRCNLLQAHREILMCQYAKSACQVSVEAERREFHHITLSSEMCSCHIIAAWGGEAPHIGMVCAFAISALRGNTGFLGFLDGP